MFWPLNSKLTMHTFPKTSRLLKRSEFQEVLDRGCKVVCPSLVMVGRQTNSDATRLGMIVSKKVGGAVVRNRVKRSLRERFRQHDQKPTGLDIVIIARHNVAEISTQSISAAFDQCLQRLARRITTGSTRAKIPESGN